MLMVSKALYPLQSVGSWEPADRGAQPEAPIQRVWTGAAEAAFLTCFRVKPVLLVPDHMCHLSVSLLLKL